jgi:hypothetical protein
MTKLNPIWIVILILAGVGIYYFGHNAGLFAVIGTETMTRTLPTSVEKGSTFTLTYNVVGATGNYIVSVADTISGSGCVPSGLHQFFIADDYTYKKSESFTYTAPSTTGSCTFTGDYKFGNFSTKTFTTQTVNIVCTPQWSCTAWGSCQTQTCDWTGKTACDTSFTMPSSQTRTCTDSKNCGTLSGKPIESQTCDYQCARSSTKKTRADTNCDGIVTRDELGIFGARWMDGTLFVDGAVVTRDELGSAGMAWVGGN